MSDKLKLSLVIALLVAGIALLVYQCQPKRVEVNLAPFRGIGEVLAEETSKKTGDSGEVIILIWEGSIMNRVALKTMRKELLKGLDSRGVKILATETIPPPLFDDQGSDHNQFVTTEQFLDIIGKHPGADAIVSMVGTPDIGADFDQAASVSPPWIVLTPLPNPYVAKGIKVGVVACAIVPRVDKSPENARSTTRDWFDTYYQVITIDNIDLL